MSKSSVLILASCIALVAAIVFGLHIMSQKKHFDKRVRVSLGTADGYDSTLIKMVKNFEHDLATRASFGYSGGKDPFTGRVRQVVSTPTKPRGPAKSRNQTVSRQFSDPFKLTAIIADGDESNFTAIVMDGERSYSVGTGDAVSGRRVTRITKRAIYMEDKKRTYYYDISGTRDSKEK